ncbi:MAG: hypothetical protein ACOCQ0_02160 [Desulfosalsimonas sp.]
MRDFKYFLKDFIRRETDFSKTSQARGIAPPPIEKPPKEGAGRIGTPLTY